MPSTYTGTNKIEKMATGEDDNTWGDRLNNNFDILDQSLDGWSIIDVSSGSATVSISNAQLSNGTSRVLVFIGNPATSPTVTFSGSVFKMYWLINNCSKTLNFTMGNNLLGMPVNSVIPVICDPGSHFVTQLSRGTSGVFTTGSMDVTDSSVECRGTLFVDGALTARGGIATGANTDIASGRNILGAGFYSTLEVLSPRGAFTNLIASATSSLGVASASTMHVTGNTNVDVDLIVGRSAVIGASLNCVNFNASQGISTPSLAATNLSSTNFTANSVTSNGVQVNGNLNSTGAVAGQILSSNTDIRLRGSLIADTDVVAAGTGFFHALTVNGTGIVPLIQSLIPSAGDPSNINGGLVLSGISLSGTANGTWVVMTFGSIAGTRNQVAIGFGNATNGQQISVPGGYNYSNFAATASLAAVTVDQAHQMNILNVGVQPNGIVSATGIDWGNNQMALTASWSAIAWITGV